MEKSVLVSVRLPESVVRKFDDRAEKTRYRKRSSYINAACEVLCAMIDKGLEDKAFYYSHEFDDIDEITFKYHRKVRV